MPDKTPENQALQSCLDAVLISWASDVKHLETNVELGEQRRCGTFTGALSRGKFPLAGHALDGIRQSQLIFDR